MKLQTKVLFILWFIALFHPFRVLNNYVGGLSFLYKIQTILLYCLTLFWAFSSEKKVNYSVFMFIILLHIFGTFFIAQHTGYAKTVTRIFFEFYLLSLITFSFFNSKENLDYLFTMFVLHFLYYAIWGILGKGIVQWDYILNEEDAYGPMMGMGAVFCFFFYLGEWEAKKKLLGLATSCICLVGVISSFARGAFIAIFVSSALIWLQSKNKVAGAISVVLAAIIILTAASYFFPENQFWEEMKTISQGTSVGTGLDRKVLWGIAWEEFKLNSIFGVGPHNFGVCAPDYATEKARVRYPDLRTLWGRSLHNVYLQVLSEQGIVGAVLFLALLINFWKRNKRIRLSMSDLKKEGHSEDSVSREEVNKYYCYSQGILFSVICYLLNAFFYQIYEYYFFWHQLILNMLLYLIVLREEDRVAKTPSANFIHGFKRK